MFAMAVGLATSSNLCISGMGGLYGMHPALFYPTLQIKMLSALYMCIPENSSKILEQYSPSTPFQIALKFQENVIK